MASRKFSIRRSQKLYCRKAFTCGTKKFLPGDVFPYKKMMVSWRRVVNFYSAMIVIGENDLAFENVMEQKRIRLGTKKTTNTAPKKTTNAVLKNHGRGWYSVLVDGVAINKNKIHGKPNAEKLMGEL